MTPAQAAWLAQRTAEFDRRHVQLVAAARELPVARPMPDQRSADQRDWDEEQNGDYR